MGQRIELRGAVVVGDVAIYDTDRAISGQDGDAFASIDEATDSEKFSAQLAVRIFEADDAVSSVFVQSNQVVVGRTGGWPSTDAVGDVIERFFVHYDE